MQLRLLQLLTFYQTSFSQEIYLNTIQCPPKDSRMLYVVWWNFLGTQIYRTFFPYLNHSIYKGFYDDQMFMVRSYCLYLIWSSMNESKKDPVHRMMVIIHRKAAICWTCCWILAWKMNLKLVLMIWDDLLLLLVYMRLDFQWSMRKNLNFCRIKKNRTEY